MRYQIKLRCLQLGITMKTLMFEVSKRTGEKLCPCTWSSFIGGGIVSPKAERCLKAADEILTEWEQAKK